MMARSFKKRKEYLTFMKRFSNKSPRSVVISRVPQVVPLPDQLNCIISSVLEILNAALLVPMVHLKTVQNNNFCANCCISFFRASNIW